ncbi:hypothetical protein BDQ12DRAFT_732896 [Crucibulum laeve]|uniref:EKC/KEOPS complex subunit GON7 n=1 Tax=Crucibulum laeve TaxID=68775 RepID=A0A5C3M9P4_9AGAR|nr:hypothetical protein BDQ12DRAFT_732896 [Crucibulum laeve]
MRTTTINSFLRPSVMSSISITYEPHPPAAITAGNLATAGKHEYGIKSNPSDGQKAYYGALRAAIADAKNQTGEELTSWRDAVGKAELNKEPKKVVEEDEVEEEEEEA